MPNYKVTDTELSGIANAIRAKGGTSASLVFPSGFVSAISAISGAGTYGSKTILSNGEYDPTTDGFDAFSHVTVSVPTSGSTPVLVSKTISENGTYNPADDSADAYSQVIVSVSGGGGNNDIIMEGDLSEWTNNSLSKLRDYALLSNYVIESVTLPSCSVIGAYAFSSCTSLTTASFQNCLNIGSSAFRGCTALENVSIPKCTTIGNFAFANCNNLKKMLLPSCSTVFTSAFYTCTFLNTVMFSDVTEIQSSAFTSCHRLVSLYLLGSSICTLGTRVFNSTPISQYATLAGKFGSIYVKQSLYDAYIIAPEWSAHASRFVSLSDESIADLVI